MKRSDKDKVLLVVTTLMIIFTPILMDSVGSRWFIGSVCVVFFILLLWYSYGPKPTTHK